MSAAELSGGRRFALVAGGINLVAAGLVGLTLERAWVSLLLGTTGFWLVVFTWPGVLSRDYLACARNYIFALFFLTIVVATPLLYAVGTWITLWSPFYWSYVNDTLLLWILGFAAYAYGVTRGGGLPTPPRPERAPEARPWMLLTGLALVLIGVTALTLAAGSLQDVLAIRGQRVLAREIINVSGHGRYVVWFSGTSMGAALLWQYTVGRFQLGKAGALIAALLLYLPLVPFYSFTSGRGATLMPLFLLMGLYYRNIFRFPVWWFAGGFAALIPVAYVWSLYRLSGQVVAPDALVLRAVVREFLAVFSRLDVSVGAVAGFGQGHLPHWWGETLLAALEHPIPEWIIGRHFEGGTTAMAKAIFADPMWDRPSPLATPLVIEGYLNFGVVGVALFCFCLGRLTRWVDRHYSSRDVLVVTGAVAATFALPFGASLEVLLSGFTWNVAFPFLLAVFVRDMFRSAATARTIAASQGAT